VNIATVDAALFEAHPAMFTGSLAP